MQSSKQLAVSRWRSQMHSGHWAKLVRDSTITQRHILSF